MELCLVIGHPRGLNGHRSTSPNSLHALMIHASHCLCVLSQGRPKITWYEISPSITCMRVHALMGPTLKSKYACPRVHCYNDPIPTTWSGSWLILSRGMPKASNVKRGKMLVKALVSIKALLIWETPRKAVTYKGLSPSTARLAKIPSKERH